MIAVLPQTEHPHRSANGEAATVQSQLESGCFIGGTLLVGPGLDLNCSESTPGLPMPRPSILNAVRQETIALRDLGLLAAAQPMLRARRYDNPRTAAAAVVLGCSRVGS